MNFSTAKNNMLMNQIRTWDFISPDTISIMNKLHREEFVPVTQRKLAFCDVELPIGNDESMMKPILEGRILQSLELSGQESVLEVGTGSGYMTALLALSCQSVTSIDIHEDFVKSAEEKTSLVSDLSNIDFQVADIFDFRPTKNFDAIVLTGSVEVLPQFLFDYLNENGKVFAISGDSPVMTASIYTKQDSTVSQKTLFETVVKPLTTPTTNPTFEL